MNSTVVSNACAEAVMPTWARFILACRPVFLLLEAHGQVTHTKQHLRDGALGWPGEAHRSQERRGGRADEAPGKQLRSGVLLGSTAFAAFLLLFVRSWKCDILKLVFIETNVRRGESS